MIYLFKDKMFMSNSSFDKLSLEKIVIIWDRRNGSGVGGGGLYDINTLKGYNFVH